MSQIINEIKQDLYGVKKNTKKTSKPHTLMEMVFSDHMGQEPNEMDNPGYDTAPTPNEPMGGDEMQPIQGELPSEQVADPEIQSILSNIRLAVIKGLGKLAEKPQSVEYDTLKRILSIVDKPIETQNKAKQ